MEPGGHILIRRWPDTPDERSRLLVPRDDLLTESTSTASPSPSSPDGPVRAEFGQAEGPFTSYSRSVESDNGELLETTAYRTVIPWFGWLFRWPVRRVLARRGSSNSWWAPPDQLDATQILVVGLLAAASMSAAFVNTLFTQTVNFAADDFGASDTAIGIAGAIVRAGIVIAIPAAVIADRIGRRRVIVGVAWLAPLLSVVGALAPNFATLVATQTLARPMGIALAFLVGVVASEEMPRNSRTYTVSILAMAAGLGAGIAVIALSLADLGPGGWRLIYLLSAIWCVVALDLTRRLPETRRFTAAHITTVQHPTAQHLTERHLTERHRDTRRDGTARSPRINRKRLLLLSVVAFAGNVFIGPASLFQNNYLSDVRGYSGGMIAVFSIAVGTPASIGLILGGRIADTRGRRHLIAFTVPLGTAGIVGAFTVGGVPLWILSLVGGLLLSAAYPALAVYRTELFPTGNRSRATGLVTAAALVGGILGLLSMGALLDADWSYGQVLGTLAIGQLIVTVLVVVAFPETAHLELEQLNPEDAPIDLHHPADESLR